MASAAVVSNAVATSAENAVATDCMPRIAVLDGLRGIAILLVVISHLSQRGALSLYYSYTPWHKLFDIARFGWSGVDLFFALSGFLITSILLKTKGSPHYFASFYGRRLLRIFPLYFCVVLVIFRLYLVPALQPYLGAPIPSSHEPWFWTYLANWKISQWPLDQISGFWSLCVEEQFYFAWPLVVLWTPRRLFPALCIALIVFSAVMGITLEYSGHSYLSISFATFPRSEGILFGALIAWLRECGLANRAAARLRFATIAFFGLMLTCALRPAHFRGYWTLEIIIAALGWSLLLLQCVADPRTWFSRLCADHLFQKFGKFSYAIYVLHGLVITYIMFLARKLLGGQNRCNRCPSFSRLSPPWQQCWWWAFCPGTCWKNTSSNCASIFRIAKQRLLLSPQLRGALV